MLWTKPIRPRAHKVLKYYYFCDITHPLADTNGVVYYHRHVASEARGRWLQKDECVHHVDGNRQNNEPSNLLVLTKAEHSLTHKPKELTAQECPVCLMPFSPTKLTQKFCDSKCAHEVSKRIKINVEQMRDLVWRFPLYKVAEQLNVSGRAVSDFCKRFQIKKPPVGYWVTH
jgi:hypothetical protein